MNLSSIIYRNFPRIGVGDPPVKSVQNSNTVQTEGYTYFLRGYFVHVTHASMTKNFGSEMLTWVWLTHALHELTKPKSTFAAPKIFCGR